MTRNATCRRSGAENATDCGGNAWGIKTCGDFYEWNARTQITTWNPTKETASVIPGGPIDYASKHWSGLINDYYAARAKLVMGQAIRDSGAPLNTTAVARLKAELAYRWTTDTTKYPTEAKSNTAGHPPA
jgi:hypothetical protein